MGGDATYLHTSDGKLYLAAVQDACSRWAVPAIVTTMLRRNLGLQLRRKRRIENRCIELSEGIAAVSDPLYCVLVKYSAPPYKFGVCESARV